MGGVSLFCAVHEGPQGTPSTSGGDTWEEGREVEKRRLAYNVEDPLTVFISAVSLKTREKEKPLGRVSRWKDSSKVWGMEGDTEKGGGSGSLVILRCVRDGIPLYVRS